MTPSFPYMIKIAVRKGNSQLNQVKFNLAELPCPEELKWDDTVPFGEYSKNIVLNQSIKKIWVMKSLF